jgi:hypothetical protein
MAKKRRLARQVYVEHLLKIEQDREQHLIKRRTRGKRQRSPEPEEEVEQKVVAEHDDETDAPRITKRHRSEKLPETTAVSKAPKTASKTEQ